MASSFWQGVAVYFGFRDDPEEAEHDREAAGLSTRQITVQASKFGVASAVLWTLFEWATAGFDHLATSIIGGAMFACAMTAAGFFATRAARDRGQARAAHERRRRD